MSYSDIEKLKEIFRAVFEVPPATDVSRMEQKAHPNWDSLCHVTLVAALESEFNITLDTADALRITSFETTRQLLEERGVGASVYRS